MEKKYFTIPVKNIWNKDAILDSIRVCSDLEATKKRAESLSKQYNSDFAIYSLKGIVSTKTEFVEAH